MRREAGWKTRFVELEERLAVFILLFVGEGESAISIFGNNNTLL